MILTGPCAEFISIRNKHDSHSIGFVPTMGALHEGHLSLVRKSTEENDITVVSIFVNPAQFNDPEDLIKYPRTLDADLKMLEEVLGDKDIVFIPKADDIFSEERDLNVNLGHLDNIMEGEHRKGHFPGVIKIVNILFDLVKPGRAYFGQKDFQQLAVIREMIKQTKQQVSVISCPVIREPNGLAMSSRNSRLDPHTRKMAGIIYASLKKYREPASSKTIDIIRDEIVSEINKTKVLRVEYFEIVDELSFIPLKTRSEIMPGHRYYACIAAFAGDIRLIDNTMFSFSITKG